MYSLLALLLLLSPAACRAVPADPQAIYVQDGVVASSTGTGDGYTQLSVENDHGQLLLVLHGDKVTALLDGEVLPGERIVRDGDKLTVRGEGGESLFEVRVLDSSNSLVYPYDAKAYAVTPDGLFRAGDWGGAYAFGARRKLIGITTSPVGAALREQLGLDEDAFVVESVSDGMPAQLGGVKPFDIVTAIDGEPASSERLREVLDGREPGEELRLTVLRQGQSRDLTLIVQEPREQGAFAYAGDAYADATTVWRDAAESAELMTLLAARGDLDAERAKLDDKMAKLESKMQKAREKHDALSDQQLAELAEEQAVLAARKAELEAAAAQREGGRALYQAGDASRWLMLPERSAADASAERLAQLEERLARLEELLERLAARGVDVEAPPAADKDEQP